MAIKLKSLTTNPLFPLALKALFFGGLFFLINSQSLLGVAVFLLLASFLYLKPVFNSNVYPASFLVIVSSSLVFVYQTNQFWRGFLAIIFAVLFFILLGLKELVLIKRFYWYLLMHLALIYLLFSWFFIVNYSYFWLSWLFIVFVLWFLIREMIGILNLNIINGNLSSLLIVFLIGQLLWILSWLSLNFIALSNLAFITLLLIYDLTANLFEKKSVFLKKVVKDCLLYLGLVVLILMF